MIASLPMYWRPENAEHWLAFWNVLQRAAKGEGCDLPRLSLPDSLPVDWTRHWRSPDLALSMTCGLPFRTALRGKVQYVATLDFGLEGPRGYYHSCLITRPDMDLSVRPVCLAYNAADSQSGWAAKGDLGADGPALSYGSYLATGSHAASLAAVAQGNADVAFIDCVTWRILSKCDPASVGVTVRATTSPRPGLPLITAKDRDPEPLRRALHVAVEEFRSTDPMVMGGPLGVAVLSELDYYAQSAPAPPPLA